VTNSSSVILSEAKDLYIESPPAKCVTPSLRSDDSFDLRRELTGSTYSILTLSTWILSPSMCPVTAT
jgi:hypothetical protein